MHYMLKHKLDTGKEINDTFEAANDIAAEHHVTENYEDDAPVQLYRMTTVHRWKKNES